MIVLKTEIILSSGIRAGTQHQRSRKFFLIFQIKKLSDPSINTFLHTVHSTSSFVFYHDYVNLLILGFNMGLLSVYIFYFKFWVFGSRDEFSRIFPYFALTEVRLTQRAVFSVSTARKVIFTLFRFKIVEKFSSWRYIFINSFFAFHKISITRFFRNFRSFFEFGNFKRIFQNFPVTKNLKFRFKSVLRFS